MIGAPNTRGQKYWVGIVQWAAETSVSEEIADILSNHNIDDNDYNHKNDTNNDNNENDNDKNSSDSMPVTV